MNRIWSRREVIYLSTSGAIALSGCLGGEKRSEPLVEHFGGKSIVYKHDRLRLSISSPVIQLGGTFKFTVKNTSDSDITLGCGNPWTLLKFRDDQWNDIIWTSAEGFASCATVLEAGKTRTEQVTLERSALETPTETVQGELTPGKYKLVLLSTDPFLGANFRVESAE
jgi:hypothetical protein